MRKLFLSAALLFMPMASVLAVPAATPAADAALTPDQVVQETAKQLFDTVNSKKDELQKNPQELYDVVGGVLLPHFDFDYASRLVLGQYWRTATPDQQKAFVDAFYKYLVHSYADALLKGNYSERNVQVEPWRPGTDPNRAFVKTKVMRENAQPVEVDYVLTNKSGTWKAFDVTIEGISYVLNYRNQFGPEIQQRGLDELIARLKAEASSAPVEQPKAASHG